MVRLTKSKFLSFIKGIRMIFFCIDKPAHAIIWIPDRFTLEKLAYISFCLNAPREKELT